MMKTILIFETISSLGTIGYLLCILHKQKFEIQKLTCFCDTTRTFRHDFSNIMQAIGGYIKTNNMYDLKEYYNRLIPECFNVNSLYRFHSKLMTNTAIYSIISNKYNLAEKENVKMSLNILLDLNLIHLDTYHLSKILGILLDNAIEASSETKNKIVNLTFQPLDTKQMIIIENTYLSKGISTKKIFEKNFTTKQKNSGLGLWEIQKIIKNHKNLNLKTEAGPEFFTQTLLIS
ncbi:MAG: GHKL domain-containing protein [Clostridia bacterium]|nr:GHKL domain-containing protein [Clostridia bacterium]